MNHKYRIYQRGRNSFCIQKRFLWFWIDACEYNHFFTLQDARECIQAWADNKAVRGRIYEP